jgi:hypothetical protein
MKWDSGPQQPPLFRRVDWLSFWLVTVLLMAAYSLTRAPNVTLGTSGELSVAAMYAGVPRPPGYPIWTLLAWLFTKLVPFSNPAWRVSLFSSLAAALACGLVTLMVSRGSSLFLENLEPFKKINRALLDGICLVAGFVAGLLFGFHGFLWSQAVIVSVFPFSVLLFSGLMLALLRWVYAPHQYRYLYLAWFLFGVGFIQQPSLVVVALAMQTVVALTHPALGRDMFLGNVVLWLLGPIGLSTEVGRDLREFLPVGVLYGNLGLYEDALPVIYHCLGLASLVLFLWLCIRTKRALTAMPWGLVCFLACLAGTVFCFYPPIASMTNPPMNWGYPRTLVGFVNLLGHGSYCRIYPTTDFIGYFKQLSVIIGVGTGEEFSFLALLLAVVPFFFLRQMMTRECAWLIGLASLYALLGPILVFLFNPPPNRESLSFNRFYFTPSHLVVGILAGYGLAFLTALLVTQYERSRKWVLSGFAVLACFLFWRLAVQWRATPDWGLHGASLVALVLVVAVALLLVFRRRQVPITGLLAAFALMPLCSIFAHWADSEQRDHLFGYWYGHDMFTAAPELCKSANGQPLYPPMAREAILFAGTDSGRFCATYMIFGESFVPPRDRTDRSFDRRDVYLICQNCLADGTYLTGLRAQYFRSAQIDPPLFSELARSDRERDRNVTTNLFARMLQPVDRFFQLRGARIEKDWRAGKSLVPPSPFPGTVARGTGGLYPGQEIYTPSQEDSQKCFAEYMAEAQERMKQGKITADRDAAALESQPTMSGTMAVMAINGLLAKVIFDRNTNHEYYIEESFPLEWMFPHLTPSGLIMKINRAPVAELTEETLRRDHEFWRLYSQRLTGDSITSDTSVSNLCAFAETLYLRRDYNGFQGNRKFLRDPDAQRAFAKLRSSIGGLYAWRLAPDCPPAFRPKSPAETERLKREADFAFKQAWAFCPGDLDLMVRYAGFLVRQDRLDEARLLAHRTRPFTDDQARLDRIIALLANRE